MNTSKIKNYVICFFALAVLLLGYLYQTKETLINVNTSEIRHDTIKIEKKPIEHEFIKHALINKEKVIDSVILRYYYKDTIKENYVNDFVALIDTVLNKDSLHIEFWFPEYDFKVKLKQIQDSLTIINEKQITYIQADKYGIKEYSIIGGAVLIIGFLLGLLF